MRSTTLFLKKSSTVINGKTYHHYKIVESYREENKVKHRILFNIGTLTDEQAEQLKLALQVKSNPSILVAKESDLVVTKSIAYLDVIALRLLWQDWKLHTMFPDDRWIEALVINRCVDPSSKIRLQSWAMETVLAALIPAIRTYNEFDVYRELDRLNKQEDELQRFLHEELRKHGKLNTQAYFYDITSSYMEGSRCVIAKLGYSRDHRPDRGQIVIALMITPEGYPFYWQVLDGNTQDITTIEPLVHNLKRKFGIEQCTLVFDRGMVSKENLEHLTDQGHQYVSAMDKDEIRTTVLDLVMPEAAKPEDWEQVVAMREFVPYDDNALMFYRSLMLEGNRYTVTFDVQRFLDQTKLRQRSMQAVEAQIRQMNERLRQARKSRNELLVKRDVQKLLSRKGFKKLAETNITPLSIEVASSSGNTRQVNSFQIELKWKQDELQDVARLDGLTCFITNMNHASFSDREVVSLYRRKNKVEEAFHEIKSHLQLRPMHVTRTERVKAHVTICMLANFLMNDMEQRLQAAGQKMSPPDVLQALKSCQIHKLEITTAKRSMWKVQEITETQQAYLTALRCEKAYDPKFKKQVLELTETCL
jgi:transposase